MKLTVCTLGLLLALGCQQPGSMWELSATTRKVGDSVGVYWMGDEAVLEVHSDIGLGQATIIAGGGTWPPRVSVRLYLEALEGMTLWNDQITFEREDLDVAIEEGGEYIEVAVPSELLQEDAPEFQIHWIDFYR